MENDKSDNHYEMKYIRLNEDVVSSLIRSYGFKPVPFLRTEQKSQLAKDCRLPEGLPSASIAWLTLGRATVAPVARYFRT